ncbi:MAG: hypothetical protein ACXWVS_08975 [Hyphomicrobium sp.]
MQRVEAKSDEGDFARLAPDVPELIRAVSDWAAERPIVAEVVLFGDRLRAGRGNLAPVQIAVRYDDRRMVDGFDDWIEQLRTNFADLSMRLSEPVTVLTPDCKTDWDAASRGTEIPAFSTDKVRLVVVQTDRPPCPAPASHRPSRLRQALHWTWPSMSAPLTAGRR